MVACAVPLLLALVGVLAACGDSKQQDRRYCDNSGCYACTGDTNDTCYPVPGDPTTPPPGPPGPDVKGCDNDAACGAGRVCNLGKCEPACKDNNACAMGEACISGRCRPTGSSQCGVAGALCTSDAKCGAGRRCINNACAADCSVNKCALGQVCQAGSCIEDPMPTMTQCLFDADCGAGKGGFRCINAYCLPTCTEASQCQGGAACVRGTCRGNRLPN